MTALVFALAFALAALAVWLWLRMRASRPRSESRSSDELDTIIGWSPQSTRVLTGGERMAYDTLRQAFPGHMVLAQVPLARFMKVPTRNSYAEWLRRAGHLCADLLLCDRHSQVLAVIEIHASEGQTSERALKRQKRVARVLKAAKVPLHVWADHALPSVDQVREALQPSVAEAAPPRLDIRVEPAPGAVNASRADDASELREPPPSTWFDELDPIAAPQAADKTNRS